MGFIRLKNPHTRAKLQTLDGHVGLVVAARLVLFNFHAYVFVQVWLQEDCAH